MALTPNSIAYGSCRLENQVLLAERDLSAALASTTFPDAHIVGTSVAVTVSNVNGTSNAGVWALALVEDATDVGGNFTDAAGTSLASGVACYREISNGITDPVGTYTLGDGSFDATLNAAITKAGTYRLVLIRGNASPEAKRLANVDTGAASSEYHVDSDGSLATGTLAGATIQVKIAGWVGRRCKVPASGLVVATPSDNQRYRDQPTITVDLAPATSGTSFVNPKNIVLAVSTDAAGATIKKSSSVTLNTSGVSTFQYKVDTDFSLTPADHYLQVGVNATLGNATTPANQQPALASVATVTGLTTSQLAWIVFDNSHDGAYTQVSSSQVRDAGGLTVGSGIQVFTNAGLTTAGVGVFATSGYALAQNIFKRTGAVNLTNAVPFMETYIADAYGAALASVTNGFSAATQRMSDSVAENTQTLSTDASGRLRWNYTLSSTMPAFNRHVKAAQARQTGSHVSTGPDNPASPPATFSLGNGDRTAPFPGYGRKVVVSGTGFSAGKEPSDTENNVFGVNSEITPDDVWSGTLTGAALNANGVPTGAGTRQQTLGAGSLKCKWSSLVNEGNIKVIDLTDFCVKDVAGRDMDLSGTESVFLQRALFDDTLDVVTDAGTSLNDAQTSLDDNATFGYHTGNNSLDTVAAPADGTTYLYYLGGSDVSATRTAFALTLSGSSPVIGFNADTGNFGHFEQQLSFAAADNSIGIALTPAVSQSDPTLPVRIGAHTFRITPAREYVDVTPDAAPSYVVWGLAQDGTQTQLESGVMTTISGFPSDFYFDLTIPLGYESVKVNAHAAVAGATTPGGGEAQIQVGYKFDAVGTFVGIHFK